MDPIMAENVFPEPLHSENGPTRCQGLPSGHTGPCVIRLTLPSLDVMAITLSQQEFVVTALRRTMYIARKTFNYGQNIFAIHAILLPKTYVHSIILYFR